MQRITALLFLLLLFFVSTSLAEEPANRIERARTVILVRHGEKATDDPRDPSLSEAGALRAEELARVLSEAGVTHIYSTAYKRTRQTVSPLADSLGLEVVSYSPRAPEQFAGRLQALPAGSVALVVGHSNTTPGLYELLCGQQASGLEEHPRYGRILPESAYDRMFMVTLMPGEEGLESVGGMELRYGGR